MFKKIKTGMMIILVIGMTMLMSSAGCDNAADSGGGDGGSSSSLIIKQPILKSANGSTLTITHDDPKEVVSGSFIISLVEADRKYSFMFSEKRGTWARVDNNYWATLTLQPGKEAYIGCTWRHYFDLNGGSFPYINTANLINNEGSVEISFLE